MWSIRKRDSPLSLPVVHPAFPLRKGRAALGQTGSPRAVAVGLWRTATKKPDGLPERSRCLLGIYIGYEVAESGDRQSVSSREGRGPQKESGKGGRRGGRSSRLAIEGRRSVSANERSLTIRPICGTARPAARLGD